MVTKMNGRFLPVFFFLILLGCGSSAPPGPADEVTLQLRSTHQAQFAGFYVAKQTGLYAGQDIDVTFLEGGRDVAPSERLLSGRADFAVVSPEEMLIRRSRGEAIYAIAAIYRQNAVVFAARKGSGILRPNDFQGKTVAVGDSGKGGRDLKLQFYAMMHRLGLDCSKVHIVPYDSSYAAFFKGDVDVTPAYYTSGIIKMRQRGLNPTLIWPADYGIRFYSDIIVTTDELAAENPDLVARFLKASLLGWKETIGDSRQAVKKTLKYAPVKDPKLQAAMLEAMLPLVHTGQNEIGFMKPGVWAEMYAILQSEGLLQHRFDVRCAYTLDFLRQVYPGTIP